MLATYEEDSLGDRWCRGEVGFPEVAARVAARCGIAVGAARAAMEHDWRHLRPNAEILAFARELGRAGRAAVVTVNPDAFSDLIVPHYGLDRDFGVIVASWQERTLDKVGLCDIALERFAAPAKRESTLLVDNRPDNVEAFRAAGGQAYFFTDDPRFVVDVPAIRGRLE